MIILVDTTILDGNVYITNGSVNGNTITHDSDRMVMIHSTKIDYNYDNQIQVIPPVTTFGERSESDVVTQTIPPLVIDLKRYTESIAIQGYLEDEPSESATTKRENLLTLAKNFRKLTVVWGITPYQTLWKPDAPNSLFGVFIQKMMFSETAGIVGEAVTASPQPERNIAVQIQLIRGQDAGS